MLTTSPFHTCNFPIIGVLDLCTIVSSLEKIIWTMEKDGVFTIKSTWNSIRYGVESKANTKMIRNKVLPRNFRLLMGKFMLRRVGVI